MKYGCVALLAALLASCDAGTGSRSRMIDTPDGPIATTVQTGDPTPQHIVLATPSEIAKLQSYAARAPQFAGTYGGSGDTDLRGLDEAFRRWQLQESRVFASREVVEILGAYLGEKLVGDLNMEWVVVTDEHGTDYAVRSKQSDVMAFPFSSVEKRIDRNQYDFMVGVFHGVRSMLESGEYRSRNSAHDG